MDIFGGTSQIPCKTVCLVGWLEVLVGKSQIPRETFRWPTDWVSEGERVVRWKDDGELGGVS